MRLNDRLLVGGLFFVKSLLGIITRPYETYRGIIKRSDYLELVPVAGLSLIYFALASVIRVNSFRPFILTRQFIALSAASAATCLGVSYLIWILSRLVKGSGDYKKVFVGWGYTLIPTLCWFLMTSVLYLILPPPRTMRWEGILFSLIFLIVSLLMLFWKITLSYLTLRFSMKLDLPKITAVAVIMVPIIALYSVLMYKVGIFRVPFI